MGLESTDVFRLDLGPVLHGQMRIAKLKSAYNLRIIGPRGLGCIGYFEGKIWISCRLCLRTHKIWIN